MTIYDISEKAGVSIATISRVINGSGKVSDETRKRVLKIIEEVGYTPNAFARGLGLDTMKTVGILCSDSRDPYLAHALYHIEKALRKSKYDSLLCCTGLVPEIKKSSLDLLISKRVDGIILIGSNYVEDDDEKNDYIREAAKKLPIMIVNGILDLPNIYCTVCDDFDAIYQVTNSMITCGKKNLLYIYDSTSYSGMKKLAGFKSALNANSLQFKEENALYISNGDKSVGNTKNYIATAVQSGVTFDAVVTSDDILAIGAIKYAKQENISIPNDLFVSGFNNFNISECCDPELTSIDNNLEAICIHCVATLMGVFEGNDMPKITIFAPKIVERNTTQFETTLIN